MLVMMIGMIGAPRALGALKSTVHTPPLPPCFRVLGVWRTEFYGNVVDVENLRCLFFFRSDSVGGWVQLWLRRGRCKSGFYITWERVGSFERHVWVCIV